MVQSLGKSFPLVSSHLFIGLEITANTHVHPEKCDFSFLLNLGTLSFKPSTSVLWLYIVVYHRHPTSSSSSCLPSSLYYCCRTSLHYCCHTLSHFVSHFVIQSSYIVVVLSQLRPIHIICRVHSILTNHP